MELTESVIDYIKANYSTVTVRELSRVFFVSYDYLNRIFKKEFSLTINQYIILEKIYNFERIAPEEKCVKEVSLRCGFKNYSNFIRTYKKYRGCTPGEYLKSKNQQKQFHYGNIYDKTYCNISLNKKKRSIQK